MKLDSKLKRSLGRWLEGLGICLVAGSIIAYPIFNLLLSYYGLVGIILAFIGACLIENN
jgi:hypothetical protein